MTDRIAHTRLAAAAPIAEDSDVAPYTFGNFTFGPCGLTVNGKPPQEEWEAVGDMLAVQVRGIQFQVGDWLRIGEELYGELAAQAIDARKWSESTARVYRHISGKVPMENRMLHRGLEYSHHQAVAALPVREQRTWLKRALGDGGERWSVGRLKQEIKSDAPLVETGWVVMARCKDGEQQASLKKELELRGYACDLITKHGVKEL